MLKNKRGWLRIVEAFIAIMLIMGVLLILYSRGIEPRRAEEIYNFQKTILDEVAANPGLRENVLSENEQAVEDFVRDSIPAGFSFEVRICEPGDICGLPDYHEELYASERIISATLQTYNPKKVKLFMWRE